MSVGRRIWRYLLGACAARLADDGMAVAVALLALSRTGTATIAAAVMAAWLAPHVVAAPVLGALVAGRKRPGRVFACCLLGFAAAIAALTSLLGRVPLPLVLLVAIAGGALGPVVSGGLSSMVAGLVFESETREAYAWDAAGYNVAAVLGPAVATLLAVVSPQLAGYALATMAALAAIPIATLPATGSGAARGTAATRRVIDGLAVIWRERTLRAMTAATCVAFLGIGALPVAAVLLAGDGGGVLVTGFALGAVGGALTIARRPPPVSTARLARLSLLVTGAALLVAAVAPAYWLTVIAFVVAGCGDGPLLSATFQARAEYAPESARTQVFTTGAALKLGAAALGSAIIAATAGVAPWILVASIGGLCLLGCAIVSTVTRPPEPVTSG